MTFSRTQAYLALTVLAVGIAFGWVMSSLTDSASDTPSSTSDSSILESHNESDSTPIHKKNGERTSTPWLVRQLIDPSLHIDEQIEAVRSLPSDLSKEEFFALADILRQPVPTDVTTARWHVLINEIMEVTRQSRFTDYGYVDLYTELIVDKNLDPVVRDYAAQHLALFLSSPDQSDEEFEKGLTAYHSILSDHRDRQSEVVGTSLMALCELYNKTPNRPWAEHKTKFENVIGSIISNEVPASFANKISAIQSAGRLQLTSTLPQVRSIAEGKTDRPSYRLSAIASLGYFAEPSDKAFLESLAQSSTRFRFAAQTALKNYNKH